MWCCHVLLPVVVGDAEPGAGGEGGGAGQGQGHQARPAGFSMGPCSGPSVMRPFLHCLHVFVMLAAGDLACLRLRSLVTPTWVADSRQAATAH